MKNLAGTEADPAERMRVNLSPIDIIDSFRIANRSLWSIFGEGEVVASYV